ncbi:polyprenyl synthetase family protein [Miltoncostaea marina]|uniref:polyprenyl synthetase family protein n=1 Tax=Miltoncostaea marina TaxID=2843215 RepID=UPI001C3C5EE0|nr:polyprenyl synthetase family protein [Miltoncostaea marina]
MTSVTSLPPRAMSMTPLLALCEQRLAAAVSGHAEQVVGPAAATLAAGGKRVRPLLVFCAAPRAALADPAAGRHLLSAAAAVELVHMATLVHDDLLDGATMRRGRPTVAESHGAERAVCTGDYLFARAFGELTRTGSARAVGALAAAALDISQGELDQQRAAFDLSLTEEAYLARCRRKTAALFSVACRLGAMVGGAGREAEERLAAFGENVGMAFQIFDDILDLAGAPEATGKRRGTDLCDGTVTLPVILAMRLEPSLREDVAGACQGPGLEALCDRLAAHPGLAGARRRALGFVATARAAIEDGLVDGATTDALLEIADGVVDRYS